MLLFLWRICLQRFYIYTHILRIEATELEGLEECGLFKKETWEVLSLYFTVEEAEFFMLAHCCLGILESTKEDRKQQTGKNDLKILM